MKRQRGYTVRQKGAEWHVYCPTTEYKGLLGEALWAAFTGPEARASAFYEAACMNESLAVARADEEGGAP